jgi:putative peptide maturation system protein
MNDRQDGLDGAVREAIALLQKLRTEQVAPEDAWDEVGALRRRHPGTWINLVWEQETYGDKIHYDILVGAGEGTLSVSYCPDEDVPWPVRGLQRVNESLVLRVNDDPVRISQVITSLDYAWHTLHVGRHLVDMSLVDQEVRDDLDSIPGEELEAALTAFRDKRGLFTVSELADWMALHGLTEAQLETHLRTEVGRDRLRRRVVAGREEEYFAAHRQDFDRVHVARLFLADREDAALLHEALERQPQSFLAVAQERFVNGLAAGEVFATFCRGDLDAATAEVLFAAAPGEVTPPVPSGEGFELFWVLRSTPAELDAATRKRIADRLFEEWLAGRRESARVEWFWGAAEAAEVPAVTL